MKSVLFSTPMVQAILDGRKTMTRVVVKPQPEYSCGQGYVMSSTAKSREGCFIFGPTETSALCEFIKPLYQPGDVLYVQETWRCLDYEQIDGQWSAQLCYKAGQNDNLHRVYWYDGEQTIYDKIGWRSPVTMPREAARIWLRVTDVRVERVQDITEADAIAEGFEPRAGLPAGIITKSAKSAFRDSWDQSAMKSRGTDWYTNEWTWVISFERIDKPADARRCRICGCTEDHVCPGGCYWVEWDLCSSCAGQEVLNDP